MDESDADFNRLFLVYFWAAKTISLTDDAVRLKIFFFDILYFSVHAVIKREKSASRDESDGVKIKYSSAIAGARVKIRIKIFATEIKYRLRPTIPLLPARSRDS